MKPFKRFFMLSLGFFLFLFFAKFLVLAFLAAGLLTFISFAVRKISAISSNQYYYLPEEDGRRQQRFEGFGGNWSNQPEPLFNHQRKEERWEEDFRSITVL